MDEKDIDSIAIKNFDKESKFRRNLIIMGIVAICALIVFQLWRILK